MIGINTIKIPTLSTTKLKRLISSPLISEWNDFYTNDKLKYPLSPLAILFQFQTGIRLGELCVVRFTDIHDAYVNIERIYRYETKEVVNHTKGFEDRKVLLTSVAKELIKKAKEYQILANSNCTNVIILNCSQRFFLVNITYKIAKTFQGFGIPYKY